MKQQKLWTKEKIIAIKSKIYIAGPRMGQNNSMYGIELKKAPKPAKSSKVNKDKTRKKKQENTMAMKKTSKTSAQKKLPPFIQAAIDKKKKKKQF